MAKHYLGNRGMELIDLIFEKDLYIPFNEVQIHSSKGTLVTSGIGRFCKNEELEIIVDSDLSDWREVLSFPRKAGGGIIFEEDMLTAYGKSSSISMKARGVQDEKTGEIPNIFRAKEVRLEIENNSPDNYTVTRLTSFPSIFRAETLRSMSHFQVGGHWVFPSMKVEVAGKSFILFSKDGYFLHSEHKADQEYIKCETALLTALGFAASQYIDIAARYEANSSSLTLRQTVKSTDQWHSPIKWGNADEVNLVRLVAELIHADKTNRLKPIIRHYLTSPDILFVPVRNLHICILIEGLLTELQKIRQWRYQKTLKAKYDKAFKELKLPKNENEFKVFEKVGNDLAHGKISDPYSLDDEDAQAEYDKLGILTNIFNKLVLGAARYCGPYFDFTNQDNLRLN